MVVAAGGVAWMHGARAQPFCAEDLDLAADCGCVSAHGQLACSITGGDEVALQCCAADDRLSGALIELEGNFLLDPAGPGGGFLSLPAGSTVRSASWAYGDAGDPCTLEAAATIDGSLLAATNFGKGTVTVGASLQYVRVTNSRRGPCVDVISDGLVRGVLTDACFAGVRSSDVNGRGLAVTIERTCARNGNLGMPVTASDGFSSCPGSPLILGHPVTDTPGEPGRTHVDIRDSRIVGAASWGLLVFGGIGGSGGKARVILTGTEVSGSGDQNVRVVGGQDAAPDVCPGGDDSSATLILAEGNTIRNAGTKPTTPNPVGITIEGGTLGGGVGTPDASSGNVARVILGAHNVFKDNRVDVRLMGNWIQNPVVFPAASAGDDNLAELAGNCPADLIVEALDCLPSKLDCPSTARVLCD